MPYVMTKLTIFFPTRNVNLEIDTPLDTPVLFPYCESEAQAHQSFARHHLQQPPEVKVQIPHENTY
eukprot:SAG11_NODE_28643_length_319_cov_1.072727_1_plen_65_part_01